MKRMSDTEKALKAHDCGGFAINISFRLIYREVLHPDTRKATSDIFTRLSGM